MKGDQPKRLRFRQRYLKFCLIGAPAVQDAELPRDTLTQREQGELRSQQLKN